MFLRDQTWIIYLETIEDDKEEDKGEKEKKEKRTDSNGKKTPEKLALTRMNQF